MKELHFRIWDYGANKFINPLDMMTVYCLSQSLTADHKGFSIRAKDVCNDSRKEFLLSTGLFDKMGWEIYEGDIVTTYRGSHGREWVVQFDERRAKFILFPLNNLDLSKQLQDYPNLRIVGNKYERELGIKTEEEYEAQVAAVRFSIKPKTDSTEPQT